MPKRIFDIVFSFVALLLFIFPLLLLFIFCSLDTNSNGIFIQERVGQFGNFFKMFKLKTIRCDDSISLYGSFLRKFKIDELPQFWNVFKGDMSIVGPRPDISGYYDLLVGNERDILKLKPGITSVASLKYVNEEAILQQQINPKKYNDEVIFRDKVKMNLDYYHNNSLTIDLMIVFKTIKKIIFVNL
ncbi:sugar transferase [Flavobacterium luteum]|uniref:Sugar transferase n=1 Tax=Flavobacterium luteum TaxID=2026654 RepID=A0A7J5AE39_9FLAO|nr:sugar transferase [Flavobacterium luteum]KAB1155846.1 sugar transferase [Flavobacterium luteum]